jgi:hypothetical protein
MSTKTMAPTTSAKKKVINFKDVKKGDCFSEVSHYIYDSVSSTDKTLHVLKHLETGAPVTLRQAYIENVTCSADQYTEEVRVGREDKFWTEKQILDAANAGDLTADHKVRVGDVRQKGIRTIFQEIYDSHVGIFCYLKQDKALTKKELESLRQEQIDKAVAAIIKTQKNKEGVAKEAEAQLKWLQENPILPYKKGDERILRGYKVQFESRDGRYDCVDMDIDTSKEENNIRPVNINTLLWIVYKGVKYIVE